MSWFYVVHYHALEVHHSLFIHAAGEDADKAALLAQLLKSKNKSDLETANKMIKVHHQ